jgi:hypothetical protein
VLPKHNTFVPVRCSSGARAAGAGVSVEKHEHCCAVPANSKKAFHRIFASDEKAIEFAIEHDYNAVTFKDDGTQMYHFLKNDKLVFNIVKKPTAEEWGFTSWEVRR